MKYSTVQKVGNEQYAVSVSSTMTLAPRPICHLKHKLARRWLISHVPYAAPNNKKFKQCD